MDPTTHETWVFGYGSLIYRPAFPFVAREPGVVRDWSRRFWQHSTDHRGTPEHPGRVVTVVREPESALHGMAYRVAPSDVDAVIAQLDHRERGGYERVEVAVELQSRSVSALMYIAGRDNPNFVGPAPLSAMAEQVLASHGPSGPNLEYVTKLATALRAMGVDRDEAFDLEAEIQVKMGSAP